MDLSCREDLVVDKAASVLAVADDSSTSADELQCLRARERTTAPSAMYLLLVQAQGVVEASRDHICCWIAEVALEFHFSRITTAVAINYLDRYLSQHASTPHRLQLVGLVAILIASKFHEKDGISMDEAKEIAANVFTVEDITRMEANMLSALQWKLHAVVPAMYIDTFLQDLQQTRLVSPICADITAVHHTAYSQLGFLPSIAAIAITHLAYDVHGLSKAPLDAYLKRMDMDAESDDVAECQRQLRMLLPAHLWKTKKRDRSPSPSGVDEVLHSPEPDDDDESVVPEAKRAKTS
ncbi:hypothetical protein SPRG_00758 [Saprolegnia parasitica CBS 223.65]|uniref:Cyclin-like domain-containing protein n=1 Tax=Saprolegnia parasitica (strain CBS 223.65) TaxID=695850 RepID=A0A067CZN4_SAPPC|nr:hypothetical protein SPRG_00758 [Saprolegnia parasitica CBS 223.65]KDO34695.1 hypothetical protein SPRG_00758 [Saprolegnia parasitica CBS 223.65]|eukprot:XP_012194366.1 hypothetical protein SPRG_00758 [Saprolegnia parasitica CBS 223.65]